MSLHQRLISAVPLFQKYDSPISVATRLAQFALESQAGTSELFLKSNNGFGIKASPPWTGDKVEQLSGEVGGARVSEFRKYPSLEASIKDHADFFTSTPYRAETAYKQAIDATNYKDEANALTGVYAGDPMYGIKLIKLIETYNLTQYDTQKGTDKMAYIGLDIGHGNNSGPRGNNGVGDEHKVNSLIAVKLKPILEKLGHKVTYGAQQPHSPEVGLTARTNRFNQLNVDIVISLHQNAFHNANVNGFCVFYWHNHSESKKLADIMTSQARQDGNIIYGTGSIASVPNTWTNFHMVRQTKMTSVLVEYGFMTGNKDRYHIFGAGQEAYTTRMAEMTAKAIQAYYGLDYEGNQGYNPQGLDTIKAPAYQAPQLSFKALKEGDTVTIDNDFRWYDLSNNELMLSKKHDEIAGTQDVIKQVKVLDTPVSNSKNAYHLEKYNSWILEEELLEAKSDWKEAEEVEGVEDTMPVLTDNQFIYKSKVYEFKEVFGITE